MTQPESGRRFAPPTPEFSYLSGISFGCYFPATVLTNEEIELWGVTTQRSGLLTKDRIFKSTGIKRRFVADPGETALDMGIKAAEQALGDSRDIDAVFVSTSYPIGVNIAWEIKERLHLPALSALDIYAACSGFVRGLVHIKEHEERFHGKKILFVATEKYSHVVADLRNGGGTIDPSLAQTIFSDGAMAMVFRPGIDMQILWAKNHPFAREFSNLIRMPIDPSLMRPPYIEEYVPPSPSGKFEQDGPNVYRVVLENVPTLVRETVKEAGLTPQDIKRVFPHQGSGKMVDGLSDRLREFVLYKDIEDGNFSSASIPKAWFKATQEGEIGEGDIIALPGFGAGMFGAIAIVQALKRAA